MSYTKYVIVSRGRTGTTYLMSALRGHPNVVQLFEELEISDKWDTTASVLLKEGKTSYRDALNKIYGPHSETVQAVGFKILYPQGRPGKGMVDNAWDILTGMQDLRVIHLKRANMLETVRSLYASRYHSRGHLTGNDERSPLTPFPITVKECEYHFKEIRKWEEWIDKIFDGHPILTLYYDDLIRGLPSLVQVQEFLGVRPTKIFADTRKVNVEPIEEVIENYQELRDYFLGTPWREFFEVGG
jgi:hypothetical protein